jgi:hypothetical protein
MGLWLLTQCLVFLDPGVAFAIAAKSGTLLLTSRELKPPIESRAAGCSALSSMLRRRISSRPRKTALAAVSVRARGYRRSAGVSTEYLTANLAGKPVEHRIFAVAADSQFDSHGAEHWRTRTVSADSW